MARQAFGALGGQGPFGSGAGTTVGPGGVVYDTNPMDACAYAGNADPSCDLPGGLYPYTGLSILGGGGNSFSFALGGIGGEGGLRVDRGAPGCGGGNHRLHKGACIRRAGGFRPGRLRATLQDRLGPDLEVRWPHVQRCWSTLGKEGQGFPVPGVRFLGAEEPPSAGTLRVSRVR